MLKSITCACRLQVYHTSLLQLIFSKRFSVCRRNFFFSSHNCLFSSKTRNFVDKRSQLEHKESFIRFWERHRERILQQNENIEKLATVLQCDKKEAERLRRKERGLFVENLDSTRRKMELLVAEGISLNTILNNVWILHIAESRLRTYLQAMRLWSIDQSQFEEFILMFDVPPTDFFIISEKLIQDKQTCPYGNRVLYLANRLECTVPELLSRMLSKKFLFTKPLPPMIERLDIYEEYGIKKEDILTDLTCLTANNMELLKERLEILRKVEYHPIKPWLARYEYDKFERAKNFFLAEKAAAGYRSREGFLAAQLGVDVKIFASVKDQLQRKYPYLFRIRALTFMKKLRFLVSEGYNPEELLCSPGAFSRSMSTMKDRIKTLQKLGYEKPALTVLTKSATSYESFTRSILADRGLKFSEIDKNTDFVTSSNCEKNE